MNDDSRGPDRPDADALERRLTELGRERPEPVDPRFADRLEASIRAMHAEPRPIHRRYLVRPAAVLFAAIIVIAGIVTFAVSDDGSDPIRQADQDVVARPSPTPSPTASPTVAPSPTPTATPAAAAPTATPATAATATPGAPIPPVASDLEPVDAAPTPVPEPTLGEAPTSRPAAPTSQPRPEPSPTNRPAAAPTPTPTATATATPTPRAPSPQIVLSIDDRRVRTVTLTWSIDDPDGIADLVVAGAAPGGRRFAELAAGARSVTIPRPTGGPAIVVVAARDADGRELARSNRVVIAARR